MNRNNCLLCIFVGCLFISACRKAGTIDGSSPERFRISIGQIDKTLDHDRLYEFTAAIVALQSEGYTNEQLVRMRERPIDDRFLKEVDGKTVEEVIRLAQKLHGEKARF